jgi:hypothetical protein
MRLAHILQSIQLNGLEPERSAREPSEELHGP